MTNIHSRSPRRLVVATCVALLLACAFALPAQAEMTLEELLAKNVEARGGAAAWDAVDNAVIQAKMTMGPGMEAPVTLYVSDDKMRFDMELQGNTMTMAFDGTKGWQVMPMLGSNEAQEMSEEEVKQLKRQDFLRGMLMTGQEEGYTLEYQGVEEIEGTEAHKIKIDLGDGNVVYSYLDTEHYIEFMQKVDAVNAMTGQRAIVFVSYGDFKPVGDIIMPHTLEIRPEGAPAGQNLVIDSIETNTTKVNDDLFSMPAAPAAPAAGDEGGNG